MTRKILISADDFGLSVEVNEAIEIAHRKGILKTANLMIAGDAAEDAIKRAKRMPDLNVGLHLVVIEGKAILPKQAIPALVDENRLFPSEQLRMGISYFFNSSVKKQLKKEITAQFEAFRKTGLPLDHVDVHKHMHLHPTVGRLLLETCQAYALKHVRIPTEPFRSLMRIDQQSYKDNIGNHLLYHWTGLLRHQAKRTGMRYTDWCFGLSWCGHMVFNRIQQLIPQLPSGTSEMFFHPAISNAGLYHDLMPSYEPVRELETLCHPDFPRLLQENNIIPITWNDI